jgi:hypothetical protein
MKENINMKSTLEDIGKEIFEGLEIPDEELEQIIDEALTETLIQLQNEFTEEFDAEMIENVYANLDSLYETPAEKIKPDGYNKDIIGFCRYQEDGKTVYGCRGLGPTYDELYLEFIPNSSYECVREDFPWDYFIFNDENDEQKFIEKYVDKHGVYEVD